MYLWPHRAELRKVPGASFTAEASQEQFRD